MHHPPAPVFHDGQVGVFAIHQAGAVKHAHAYHRSHENGEQVFIAGFVFKGADGAAQHQPQPQKQADKEQNLPKAAQIQIFITLMAKPEIQVRRDDVAQGKEVACIRAGHHDKQGNVKQVYAQRLIFRVFAAVDNRC